MDVEGAELDALRGASSLISHYQPTLAISIYHYPDHLWNILLYLLGINPDYRFYIRNYSGHTYETVLYALPS